MINRSI